MEAVGRSDAFLQFQQQLSRLAPIDRPVLIVGERGTGKELAARRLHYLSRRWQEPLVTLNCAALPAGLISSELFGHEAGAFTGAVRRRAGRFEVAHGGTLFLDEIGNIPREAQEQLLRVVEYGSFERVGGTRPVEVDVRLVGATHADLVALADQGRFMRDLLDRLSFEVLQLPPLRRRGEDIALLARHFAMRMAAELELPGPVELEPAALELLLDHHWPGNVRELKNVVERAVARAGGGPVAAEHIVFDPFAGTGPAATPPALPASPAAPEPGPGAEPEPPLFEAVRRLELRLLRQALERARHHRGRAAALLGISYNQLRHLLRKYRDELERP